MLHVFLINPYSGNRKFSNLLRKQLRSIEDIDYFIFNILYPNHEYVLIKQLLTYLEGNELRIYVCGGQGTLHNVLNAIDIEGKLSDVEIAWLAKGSTNIFLKSIDQNGEFTDVRRLIRGQVEKIDYIRTNHGVAINSLSVGMDADIINTINNMEIYQLFRKTNAIQWAYLHSMFKSKPQEMEIEVDDESFRGKYCEVFFGNGSYAARNLKFVTDASLTDGYGNYMLGPEKRGIGVLPLASAARKGSEKLLNKYSIQGKSRKIKIHAKSRIAVNMDGELYLRNNDWTAEIVEKGLNFVIPKGVNLGE